MMFFSILNLGISKMVLREMKIILLLLQIFFTLLSMVAASPITITEFQGRYYLPFFNNYPNIERSDSYAAASETEGYNDDITTGTDPHYLSGDNSGGHIETSGSGYEGQHDYSSYTDYGNYHGSNSNPHGLEDHGNNYVHSVPVSEHVEVTKPIAIPVYKDIGTLQKAIFKC